MKAHPFQVGDKVVVRLMLGDLAFVNPPVPGRVYCVEAVAAMDGGPLDIRLRVKLVGVRRDRRCKHITDDTLPAAYFRLVHRAKGPRKRKGAR